tara:strand:+ start:21363 stop:22205 length:843 start_codon:yes stop_codon:yes gene_type:complete
MVISTSSYISNPLLKLCEPNMLRKLLFSEMNNNYKYIPYSKSKKILYNNINKIDIYGDNLEQLNVEHIFPQYTFKNNTNRLIMRSDLHNLYLCNSRLNNYRSNFKYVESSITQLDDSIKILDMKGNIINSKEEIFSKNGYLMITNKKHKIFIPTEYSRGKIARSLSYFAIKYDYIEQLNEIIDIKTLLEWNLKDPVDNEEYYKNIIIYQHQKNLNPFIINPDLMLYCFSDKISIDDSFWSIKKISLIDPMYTIQQLIDKIDILEFENNNYNNIITKIKKL